MAGYESTPRESQKLRATSKLLNTTCCNVIGYAELRDGTAASPYLSLRMGLSSHLTDFHQISYLNIFGKYLEEIQVSLNPTKITSTLHEDLFTFMATSMNYP